MYAMHILIALWAAACPFLCEAAQIKAPKGLWSCFCVTREDEQQGATSRKSGASLDNKKAEMSKQLASLVQEKNKEQLMRVLRSMHEDNYSDDDKRFMYELACRYALCEGWIEGAQDSYKQGYSSSCFLVLFGRIDGANPWHANSNKNSNIARLCIEQGNIALLHEWTKSTNIISNPSQVQKTFNDTLKSYASNIHDPAVSPQCIKWQKDGLHYLMYMYDCVLQDDCKECVSKLPPHCPIKSLLQEERLEDKVRSVKLDALLRLYEYSKGSRIGNGARRASTRIEAHIVRSVSSVTSSFASGSDETLPSHPLPARSLSLPVNLTGWCKNRGSKIVKVTKDSAKKASSLVCDAAQKVSNMVASTDFEASVESETAISEAGNLENE